MLNSGFCLCESPKPTNHLDMASIDALAKAVNEFEGGLVLVSHDMRLISQVAKEIWICDNKTVTRYDGNIEDFKMHMRARMGIDEKNQLRGDASVAAKKDNAKECAKPRKKEDEKKTIDVVPPPRKAVKDDDDGATAATSTTGSSFDTEPMRRSLPSTSADSAARTQRKAYVPPHLRKKMTT